MMEDDQQSATSGQLFHELQLQYKYEYKYKRSLEPSMCCNVSACRANGAGPLFGNQRQPIAKLTKSTNTKYIKNTFN